MPNQIQSGTMMVQPSVFLWSLGMKGEPYCQDWRSLDVPDSAGLDHLARAAGWNLFFMAGEISAVVPLWGGQNTLRRGVKRLLAQTRLQGFNCLELSQIIRKRFLGVPYISITGHPRHIQQSSQLRTIEQRAHDASAGDAEKNCFPAIRRKQWASTAACKTRDCEDASAGDPRISARIRNHKEK